MLQQVAWKIRHETVIYGWTVNECAIIGSSNLIGVCENELTGGQIAGFCKAGDA